MSNRQELILQANHVTKRYPAPGNRLLTACSDVNIAVYKGETLGIVGESGCGKTTLIKMIMQLEMPTEGEILYRGRDITRLKGEALRQNRRHIQMVFQEPAASFNPRKRVADIVTEPLFNFSLISKKEKEQKAGELLHMVELTGDYLKRYPHHMSGGQCQRVAVARALALGPEIVVCDEATSALDVSTQEKIVKLLVRLQQEKNLSMVFICHDIALVQSFSHRIAVMYLGNIVEEIDSKGLQDQAQHPYTRMLLGAIFPVHNGNGKIESTESVENIESEAPSPLDVPPGCSFQKRCKHSSAQCGWEKPRLREVRPGHKVACHLF